LQQISIERILRQSLAVVRQSWAVLLALGALLTLPNVLFQFLAPEQLVDFTTVVYWLNLVVSLLLTPLLGAAVTAAAGFQQQGRPVELGDALRAAIARWPASVGLYWAVGLAVGFGTCCLVIPGLAVATLYFVSFPVLIVEGASFYDTVSNRGHRITEGNRMPIFVLVFLQLVVFIAVAVGAVGVSLVQLSLEDLANARQFESPLYVLANWLAWVIVMPVMWVVPTATYFELIQARRELPGDRLAEAASVFD
jgi:hypothetical protein